jgi:hypothetical protein
MIASFPVEPVMIGKKVKLSLQHAVEAYGV